MESMTFLGIDNFSGAVLHRLSYFIATTLPDTGEKLMDTGIKGRYFYQFLALRYLMLIAVALIFAFPLVFMIVSSLKPDMQLLRDSSSLKAFVPYGTYP
jgi:hypothetical protein